MKQEQMSQKYPNIDRKVAVDDDEDDKNASSSNSND